MSIFKTVFNLSTFNMISFLVIFILFQNVFVRTETTTDQTSIFATNNGALNETFLKPTILSKIPNSNKRTPVKLNMKQGLIMNQVISLYVLDKAKNETCKNHSIEFRNGLRAFEPWALKSFKI